VQTIHQYASWIRFAILEFVIIFGAVYSSRRLGKKLDVLEAELDQGLDRLEASVTRLESWRRPSD
jgi:hypothetical protein